VGGSRAGCREFVERGGPNIKREIESDKQPKVLVTCPSHFHKHRQSLQQLYYLITTFSRISARIEMNESAV